MGSVPMLRLRLWAIVVAHGWWTSIRGFLSSCVLICRGAIKLYSDFYEADIIVASPIALVTKPGDEGAQQDLDYLSSIEIVVAPRCDVLQMQNWAHVQSGSLQRLMYTWAQLLWVCAPRLPPANSRLSKSVAGRTACAHNRQRLERQLYCKCLIPADITQVLATVNLLRDFQICFSKELLPSHLEQGHPHNCL